MQDVECESFAARADECPLSDEEEENCLPLTACIGLEEKGGKLKPRVGRRSGRYPDPQFAVDPVEGTGLPVQAARGATARRCCCEANEEKTNNTKKKLE